MGDTTKRRLRNFEGRTTIPVQGWAAVLVGLLFAGAGSIPLLIGVGMMALSTRPTNPPGWVVAVVGAVFILFGLAALTAGVRGLYRRRRARRANSQEPRRRGTGTTRGISTVHVMMSGGVRCAASPGSPSSRSFSRRSTTCS